MAHALNIPNLLTLARLAALPLVIVLFRGGHHWAAAGVFAGVMITDCFDGWIARRLDQCTPLGMYLDPVVDKIVTLGMFYELAHTGVVAFAVAHLFLVRELLHGAVRSTAAVRGKVAGANWMGKTKLVLETIVITWGLLTPVLPGGFAPPLTIGVWMVLCLAWCFFFVFAFWNRRVLLG